MNVMEISKMENHYENFLSVYAGNPMDVVLYGEGAGADWAINLLQTNDIKPKYIVDKFHGGGVKKNIRVISYEEFKRLYDKKTAYILIASPKHEEEIFKLLQKDFNVKQIFCFECELYYHYIHDIKAYRTYLVNKASEFERLYNRLEDDFSRLTLENVLKGRISANLEYFRKVCVDNQYFPGDIVTLGNNEVFLDIGAFVGDTIAEIEKETNGNYKKIYCFEPDKNCINVLKKNIKEYKNVMIIEKGAWDKCETLYIQQDSEHGASFINEMGEYAIELDCIDNCIDEGEHVTHIKMDIEGAELAALHGAQKIIKKNRPKLAICVYHKNEDILDISRYILSLVPEYKLFLRHHNISGTETVLYAICN